MSIDNKQLAVFTGVKRSFNALGNEHLEPLGNEHTLACNTDNNGDVPVEPRSGGELVMQALVELDKVAYIRYASVYRDFSKPEDFKKFIKELDTLIQDAK